MQEPQAEGLRFLFLDEYVSVEFCYFIEGRLSFMIS